MAEEEFRLTATLPYDRFALHQSLQTIATEGIPLAELEVPADKLDEAELKLAVRELRNLDIGISGLAVHMDPTLESDSIRNAAQTVATNRVRLIPQSHGGILTPQAFLERVAALSEELLAEGIEVNLSTENGTPTASVNTLEEIYITSISSNYGLSI